MSSQRDAVRAVLRAAEWNQYAETWLGLERIADRNRVLRAWAADRAAAEGAITDVVEDGELRDRLLAEVDRLYGDRCLSYEREEVEVITVLPDEEIEMFFTDYDPRQVAPSARTRPARCGTDAVGVARGGDDPLKGRSGRTR